MKRKNVIPISVLIIAITLALVVAVQIKNSDRNELLAIWGKLNLTDDHCLFQVIDPSSQTVGSILQVESPCNFQEIIREGHSQLVQFQEYPGEIRVFNITPQLTLDAEQVIPLNDVRITSSPVWAEDGTMYVSGVWNNQEQILRVDSQTMEMESLIVNENGTATSPSISPNGKYLLYVRLDGKTSTSQCQLDCYSQFYLFNLEANEDMALLPVIEQVVDEPNFTHCDGMWSPTGQYLAFSVGCSTSETPNKIIVIDVQTNQIVANIKPVFDDSIVIQEGWFSDQELFFGQSVPVEGETFRLFRYFVYSLETKNAHEVVDLPDFNADGTVFELNQIDWTTTKDYLVGASRRDADGYNSLVLITVNSQPLKLDFMESEAFNIHPLLSPSGDWIVYQTANDVFAAMEGSGASVRIIDKHGSPPLDTDMNKITDSLGYTWINP